MPPFNAPLIYISFRGLAWEGYDEVCLYSYVEQEIQHPPAPSTKAEQTAQMLVFLFSFIPLIVCSSHLLQTYILMRPHNGHRAV